MKASIKFRDEEKPLLRAKVPISIIGLPFQSGIIAGETNELSLNLATFFKSGPQLKIAYRPNDSFNPFSVVFKTGIGHFGSPISSSLNMSAEFNFTGGSQNPTFFVHFKPQNGDFTVKNTQSSVFKRQIDSNGRLNIRWGVKVPGLSATEEMTLVVMKKSVDSTAGISFKKLPVLLLTKIGIEHVSRSDCVQVKKVWPLASDVADPFLGVKKQMEIIQMENEALKKAVENLKCELSAVKLGTNAVRFNGGEKDSEVKDE